MEKKLKCYVLIVSRYFPASHPRAGEETGFVKNIMFLDKKHTIRANFELWEKRVKEVNAGRAYISLRYWEGKPYKSKQAEFRRLYKARVQRISIDYENPGYWMSIDRLPFEPGLEPIASNDGLSMTDFLYWFFILLKPSSFTGAIIHFNPNFKY